MAFWETFTRRSRVFLAVAVAVFIGDQVSKWMAVEALTDAFANTADFAGRLWAFLRQKHPTETGVVTVLDDFWHFRYVENPGAAWGLLSRSGEAFRTPFFLVVSLAAMIFIIAYFRRTTASQRWLRLALALVFGGAVGNFFDRARFGYVIDFIDWHWYDVATWPTFNVADSAISIGVALLLLDMFLQKEQRGNALKEDFV